MKQNFTYYCIACLCAALFLSACADDWDVRRGHVIQEGVPVTVSLDFGVSASKVVTRAAESEETERTVNRVYVFAFNSDGSLDNKMLYSPSSSTLDCIELLDFPMHSGYDKRFYAVANPTSGSGTLGTETLARIETEEELLACTSSLLVPTNIERSYFLMSGRMEASEEGGQIDVTEMGQIQGAKLCSHHTVPVIELQRVDARITFKIKGKEGLNFVPDRYWVENIPQHTYVFPHDEDYVSNTPADDYASMSEYDVQRNVEGQDEEEYYMFEFYLAENRLQPTQRIGTGDATTEGTKTLYALREKRLKTPLTGETGKEGQTEVNGAFKYANPHSAYVVFHGILSYTEEDGSYVYADATYTVHLGNTGRMDDADNPELVNNYDTERNTHYTYTVTITGVKSMRVEVEDDKVEQRPGVEGDLIFSGDAVKEMDAHYGRTQFKLNRDNILKGLSWAIRTPFQNGMNSFLDKHFVEKEDGTVSTSREDYTADQWQSLQTGLDLNDYKWVQFVIDDEAGVADGNLAKYPGYQCYCDPGNANVQAPPFGSEGAVPLSEKNYPDRSKRVVLYDVNQLVNHLYAEAKNVNSDIFDAEDNVTITAFVDEYVYVYHPKEVYYRSPLSVHGSDTEVKLDLWKKAVNRDNRMLYLCSTGSIYSPDGETSVSHNVFTITQKPIYTFYNTNDPAITNGWGTESINETGPIRPTLDPGNSDDDFSNLAAYPNSLSNGLFNTLGVLYNGGTLRNLHWDAIMHLDAGDRGDEGGTLNLQEPYNSIWYACIARNRDLNGDNIVDKDEVRWYLASIDQLTDIWIGQNSLNESAWLYHGDGRVRSHVASSSFFTNSGPDNPYVIWAEEGASRGGLSGSTSFNGGSTTGSSEQTDADVYGNENRYHYRCVRNLGISLDSPETPFDRYVTVKEDSYTNREGEQFDELVLSLDGMESNSIRSAIVQDAEQPAHNERDYVNRPYRKFAVIKDHDYKLPDNRLGSWMDYQNVKVCPEGYRMPNQRELMLMYTSINETEHGMSWYDPSESHSYVCRTAFGYNDLYGGNRPGFMYEVKTGLLFLETDYRLSGETYARHPSGYVRCVRDVPN